MATWLTPKALFGLDPSKLHGARSHHVPDSVAHEDLGLIASDWWNPMNPGLHLLMRFDLTTGPHKQRCLCDPMVRSNLIRGDFRGDFSVSSVRSRPSVSDVVSHMGKRWSGTIPRPRRGFHTSHVLSGCGQLDDPA